MTNHLGLYWPHNRVQFNGRSISEAWAEALSVYGIDILSKPDDADVAFFISDSMLDEAVIARMPSLAYFWGFPPSRMFDPSWRQGINEKMRLLALATRVLVPGPLTQDQLAGYALESQLCLPGVDTKTLDQPVLTIRGGVPQICFLSRLAPEKGLDLLIQALSLIQPRPRLIVMGPGDPAPYMQLCRELGVTDVAFIEPTDAEKIRVIKESAALVHPSQYEGFGLPPLEALYLKTPAIAWGTPQMRWLLQEDGIFVESVEGLAGTIVEVINRHDEAQRVADHGSARIAQSLTLGGAAERLWAHVHQTAKEWWGQRVHADPTNKELIHAAYEAEAKRNWAYSYGPPQWQGPARFDPGWARHWRAQHYIKELKEAKAEKIIDIGTGPVYATILSLADPSFQISALDVSETTLAHSRDLAAKYGVGGQVHTQQGYAQDLPFASESFDAAVMGEVLEHVPDPEKCVAEAYRVVKPGGVVIGTSPLGRHHWDPMHMAPAGGGWDDDSIHKLLAPYNVERLERVAESEGEEESCYLFRIRRG